MEARQIFCHNPECHARGRVGLDNITIHQYRPTKRYRCKVCQKTFVAHKGTLYEARRTGPETIDKVLILLNNGCPRRALQLAFSIDRRTISAWELLAGDHCKSVHRDTVGSANLDLKHVQADEIRVKKWVEGAGRPASSPVRTHRARFRQ